MKEYIVEPYTETGKYTSYHIEAASKAEAIAIGYLLDSDSGKKYPFKPAYWNVIVAPSPKVYTMSDVDTKAFIEVYKAASDNPFWKD